MRSVSNPLVVPGTRKESHAFLVIAEYCFQRHALPKTESKSIEVYDIYIHAVQRVYTMLDRMPQFPLKFVFFSLFTLRILFANCASGCNDETVIFPFTGKVCRNSIQQRGAARRGPNFKLSIRKGRMSCFSKYQHIF